MGSEKILSPEAIPNVVEGLKESCLSTVFTNGCFDLLHPGHVSLLSRAKARGDCLIVGLNGDESVRALKGPGRPIVPAKHRAMMLAHLECVDFVVIFEETTPLSTIKAIRPDVLIKGADWKEGEIIGQEFVESYGGRVVRLSLIPSLSTSALIARIKAL
jgi:rfaE bifunctional protein nucleotidyltransferase chain/domain